MTTFKMTKTNPMKKKKKPMWMLNLTLNKQEVYVLLRAIASANSYEERDEDSGNEDDDCRSWLVDRMLGLLPEKDILLLNKARLMACKEDTNESDN